GSVYRSLGKALFARKKYRESAAAYETARAAGFYESAVGAYEIAACYALSGDGDSALRWLEESLRSRLRERSQIGRDERFAALRKDPRFRRLAGELDPGVTGREEGWKFDLRFLTSEIRRLHPSYGKELPRDYARRLEALEQRLGAMTDPQIAL